MSFQKFISHIKENFSPEDFSTEKSVLDAYASDLSFQKSIPPRLVIWPKTVEEVQAITGQANEFSIQLLPISSSPGNRQYGDTVPAVPDLVIIDLSRMNKILRIYRKHRVVNVEPGVTFNQLL